MRDRLFRLIKAMLIIAVIMAATAIGLNALGKPHPFSMTCWESADHNGAIVCTMQPPAWAHQDQG